MNIQKFSAVSPIPQEPQPSSEVNFKAQIVTLSQKNLGQKIATNVVDTFNGKMLNTIKSKPEQIFGDIDILQKSNLKQQL